MLPDWLTNLAITTLALGGLCATIIAIDLVVANRQTMWIMNLVWPVAAAFGTLPVLWAYFEYGRLAAARRVDAAEDRGEPPPNETLTPFWMKVAKGALHCGSGCTLGDVCAEFLAFGVPSVAIAFGWTWLFPATAHGKIFAVWTLDYVFAFVFGIAFQYFTIVPMRELSPGRGLIMAIKADAASLTAWQVGMYGFMAFAQFFVFARVWPAELHPNMPVFWCMMQIAMLCGFVTAYPVNWLLIRKGIKEAM